MSSTKLALQVEEQETLFDVLNRSTTLLIPALEEAIRGNCVVVVCTLWDPLRATSLMPASINLLSSPQGHNLPLNLTFGLLPFSTVDRMLWQMPFVTLNDAYICRKNERFFRYQNNSMRSKDDFVHADWETVISRNTSLTRLFPAESFICVDQADELGKISPGNRPFLGKFMPRQRRGLTTEVRPIILIPEIGGRGSEQVAVNSKCTVLLVDLQYRVGVKTLEHVRQALHARGKHRPTVLVINSPLDIEVFNLGLYCEGCKTFFYPSKRNTPHVTVRPVHRERSGLEKDFRFGFTDLLGMSAKTDDLVRLAKRAWWSVNQSVRENVEGNHALMKYRGVLQDLSIEAPSESDQFRLGDLLFDEMIQNIDFRIERRNAIVDAVKPTSGLTWLLAPNRYAASEYQEIILQSLVELGLPDRIAQLIIGPLSDMPLVESVEDLIVPAFFGPDTINAIMDSRASSLHLIMDPVELGTTLHYLRTLIRTLSKDPRCSSITDSLSIIADRIRDSSAISEEQTDFDLTTDIWQNSGSSGSYPERGEILIILFDGEILRVKRGSRFDVVTQNGYTRTKAAEEIQSGERIIITDSQTQTSFSEQYIEALDKTDLLAEAKARAVWSVIVKAFTLQKGSSVSEIQSALRNRGVEVNQATIRGWLKGNEDVTTPHNWKQFKAFAEVLQLPIDEAELWDYFTKIKRWRVVHRLAGRQAASLLVGLFLGRFSGSSVSRFEEKYGLQLRRLVHAARVATVEIVIEGAQV